MRACVSPRPLFPSRRAALPRAPVTLLMLLAAMVAGRTAASVAPTTRGAPPSPLAPPEPPDARGYGDAAARAGGAARAEVAHRSAGDWSAGGDAGAGATCGVSAEGCSAGSEARADVARHSAGGGGAGGGAGAGASPEGAEARARLSGADRAALAAALPAPRPADEVRAALRARQRRLNRRGRVAVLRYPARAPAERYGMQSIEPPAHRAVAAGDFDPGQHAQLDLDGVARAIETVALRGVMSAHDLTCAVVSALTWKPSHSPRAPVKGAAPVASPLNADAIHELALADPLGLPPGLSAEMLRDAVTHGADAMYSGARRHGTTHNSPPPSAEAAAALRESHDADVAAGWVLDVTELCEACPLMPLLLVGTRQVPKSYAADGTTVTAWRTIADASGDVGVGSNWDVDPRALHPVPLHTMADVAAELHRVKRAAGGERVVIGAFDFAKAYRQFPNRVDDMWLHCYCREGRVYADMRIAFGSRGGGQWLCAVTHLVARAVSRELGEEGACVCFVDDSGLIVIERAFPRAEALFRAIAARVGLSINESKVLLPATRQRFIGPEWCTESLRIFLPAAKVALLCGDLEAAAAAATLRCRELLSLLQRMQWASQMVLVLASCQAPIRALIRGVPLGTRVPVTAAARDAMRACVEMLRTCNGSSVVPRAALLDGAPAVYTDASSWGFGWICHATRRFASEPWPSPASEAHINALELAAATAGALDLQAQLAAAGAPPAAVRIFCDNTAACACISSLGTSSLMLAPCTRALATASSTLDFVPLSSWVQSAANPADAPSRGEVPAELEGWTRVRYAPDVVRRWGAPAGAASFSSLSFSPPA